MPSWVWICAGVWLLGIFFILIWNYTAHSDPSPVPYFPCRGCGKRAYLIRNLCADCDPGRHIEHECALAMMGKLSCVYESETGKRSLGSWEDFEDWINNQ